ncbi:50S ribosomal protein L23 [candidate division KSB1 bacterium]|nr:MAG: 50S ribosomal protein L23 [candidate division KSB1 bacterium]
MKDPLKTILFPLVTEKITLISEKENKYGFEVDPRANKIDIAKRIEERFEVKVEKVNVMNVKGKLKRMGRFQGRRKKRKKAIVTLKKGYKIELFEGT